MNAPKPDIATAVKVTGLAHAFGRHQVLESLTFEVPAGIFFIIIGPNGSGKTTLLKLLTGLLPPQTGRIDVLERAIDAYPPRQLARRIAYVPQQAPSGFAFRALDIVMMGRAPHLGLLGLESPADRALALQAMELTHTAHLARRPVDQLSGGEQQRVFIARAICQEPQILLLDEPTASLDMSHQVRIMDVLENLKAERRLTVVMVSHDLNMAAMYADTLLLLDRGRAARLGPPRQVLDYALLEKVYGCALLVDQSPLGDYPRVHLVPARYLNPEK